MPTVPAAQLKEIGAQLFDAVGSLHEESEIVSENLVHSSLMGHDSHGVMRFMQYVADIEQGKLKPRAPFEIVSERRATAVVNGHRG